MEQSGKKQPLITLHRLCLVVPLAIQLSMPVIIGEIQIVSQIRKEGPLTLTGYYLDVYYLVLLASFLWLPIYILFQRKKLGRFTKAWVAFAIFDFVLLLLLLGLFLP